MSASHSNDTLYSSLTFTPVEVRASYENIFVSPYFSLIASIALCMLHTVQPDDFESIFFPHHVHIQHFL